MLRTVERSVARGHSVVPVVILLLVLARSVPSSFGQSIDTEIPEFTCTNQSFSRAIYLLSEKSPLPINCIVDEFEEPRVSVQEGRATLGAILQRIVSFAAKYRVMPRGETILVAPDGLQKDAEFVLNRVHSRFQVTYTAYRHRNGEQAYDCSFAQPEGKYPLNVAMPDLYFDHDPGVANSPWIVAYTNQSLLDVLTAVSVQTRSSWFCGRVRPEYIRRFNKQFAESKLPDASTWWPDERAPGYAITWGQGPFWGKGAFHGEYAQVRRVTDKNGNVHEENVTWEELDRKAAKDQENLACDLHFRAVSDLLVRGMKNPKASPVQLIANVATAETSNHTTSVAVSVTLTNTTASEVRLANPYTSDFQQAFLDVCVDLRGYQYHVTLPSDTTASVERELALPPFSASTRVVNILGAKLALDTFYHPFGVNIEKLSDPGTYIMIVRLYFKGPQAADYGTITSAGFQIK